MAFRYAKIHQKLTGRCATDRRATVGDATIEIQYDDRHNHRKIASGDGSNRWQGIGPRQQF